MSDRSKPPALSSEELRETLERLGNLALDLNDHVQDQTKAINHATTAASEARRAAFAVKEQTNPRWYGKFVGEALDDRMDGALQKLDRTVNHLDLRINAASAVLDKASEERGQTLRSIRDREEKLARWKDRWFWFGLGAVVLALAMTLLLPRFLASYGPTCGVLGGVWTTTSTNTDVCAFYRE